MSNIYNGPILRKEGKHYRFDDLEFWAEDGVICIVDERNGDYTAVSCSEFVKRAVAINEEARRTYYPSDRRRLNDFVLDMHAVYKEAKSQGDPGDIEVVKQRLKSMKRVSLVTGMW